MIGRKNIRHGDKILNNLKIIFVTTLFLGYLPIAPATYASLFALFFPYLIRDHYFYSLFFIFYFFLTIITINQLEKIWEKDAKKITADEVLGILTTFFLIPINLKTLIFGFLLFRFYDIFKFPFIKKVERITGGLGVILDDILAGILSNLTLRIILLLWQ